jgi:tetratricopeptide (TPR) repeat protein
MQLLFLEFNMIYLYLSILNTLLSFISATSVVRCLYSHIFRRTLKRKYLVQAILPAFMLVTIPGFSLQVNSKIDSLQALLQTTIDTSRVNLLNELGKQFWMSQPDSARLYTRDALRESKKLIYRKGEAEALRIIGWSYHYENNEVQAKSYMKQAVLIFKQVGFEPGLAAALNNLGAINTRKGDYAEGLQASQQALVIFKRLGNQEAIGSVLNYIGVNYQAQGNYDKAIEYCLQALQIRRRIQDHAGIAFSLINMGNMYLAADKLKSALEYYQQGLAYSEEKRLPSLEYSLLQLGETYGRLGQYEKALHYLQRILKSNSTHVFALNSVGEVYFAKKEYELSLKHLLKCLSLIENRNDITYANVLNNISKVYNAQKRYPIALSYAQRSLALSRQLGGKKEIKNAAETLSQIYAGMQDFAEAYKYQHLYISQKDSITSQEYTQRLAVLEANLELAKKQTRIETLTQEQQLHRQELKRQAVLRNVFIVGLGFTLVLGLVIFRNIGLKRKAERLLKERLERDLELERLEKEQKLADYKSRTAELEMMALRAQMNPHFIFNCLNSINRFILKNESEAASDYLTKFSKLIRLILQNSQAKFVCLENELESLRLYLEMEVSRFENHFDYQIICSRDLEIEHIEVPPLIIQPYVENAIWHGLMHKQDKGHLTIELHKENNMLCCLITDDGVGRKRAAELKSKSASKNKSLGMQITAHRLELINALNVKAATVEVTDLVDSSGESCGTSILLKIPV